MTRNGAINVFLPSGCTITKIEISQEPQDGSWGFKAQNAPWTIAK